MSKIQIIQDPEGFRNSILEGMDKKLEILKKEYSPKEPKSYLTRKETAELLRVTLPTLWRFKKDGILIPKSIGGKIIYSREDIENALIKLK